MKSFLFLCASLLVVYTAQAQAPANAPAGTTGICKDGSFSSAASKSGACRGHKGVQTWYKADVPSLPPPAPGKTASSPAPSPKASTTSMPAPAPASATRSLPAPTPAAAPPSRPAPTATQSVPSQTAPVAAPSVPSRPAPAPATNTPSLPSPQAGSKPNIASESARLKAGPAAAGGGPGLVWVNTSSKVYHCPGSDFYGKTKAGSYMPEADAKSQGARPDHNKPCS